MQDVYMHHDKKKQNRGEEQHTKNRGSDKFHRNTEEFIFLGENRGKYAICITSL